MGRSEEAVTDEDARKLATRIIDTWPHGAKAYVWRDVLIELDPVHASVAYRRCARTASRAPTPADFLDAYDAARADARRDQADQHLPAQCALCNGTGWVEASHIEAHALRACNGDPIAGTCHCHAVKPCRCSNATQAHRIVAMIHGTENL
jgi:hypothetical protein